MTEKSELSRCKKLTPVEAFFARDCYHSPWPFDDQKTLIPSYNPNINMEYHLPVEHEYGKAFHLESGHDVLGGRPARCLLQTISALIYQEISHPRYQKDPDITRLLPHNNPLIRTLKAIYETVLHSTKYAEESYSILTPFKTSRKSFQIIDVKPSDLPPILPDLNKAEQAALDEQEKKLSGFKELYQQYHDLSFKMSQIRYATSFALSGPSFLPNFPFTPKGTPDSSKMTDKMADCAVSQFRDVYQKLPYSPYKRLIFIISLIKEIIAEGASMSQELITKRVLEYNDFELPGGGQKFSRYEETACPFCPLEMLTSHGINITQPTRSALVNVSCELRTLGRSGCRGTFKTNVSYSTNDHNYHISHHPAFIYHWPKSGFSLASEALKQSLFTYSRDDSLPKKVVATSWINSHEQERLNKESKYIKENSCEVNLDQTKHYPPYITVRIKPTSDIDSPLDIRFLY